jgi:hypothetical protein
MSTMLAILFPIDIVWVPLIVVLSAVAGFAFRSRQIRKLRKQVSALEKEMLNSHAEILHMQEQMVRLQNKNNAQKSLVVSMKEVPPSDEKKDHHNDVAGRKKVK